MKNERLLLRDARCEYLLSLLTPLLSKWLKPCYDKETLPATHFKLRGSLWLSTFSCFCSCYPFSSLSRYFVSCVGLIMVLSRRKQPPRFAAGSPVNSSRVAQTTAPPVVSPPLPRRMQGKGQRLYDRGLK
jgi:hypothetical protein